MQIKSQNAIEFLSNYAFVILIITVAIAFVVILATAPKAIFPNECNIYGGFTCSGAVYSINTTSNSGSHLLVEITDSEPGIVNISSFSAIIGQAKSNAGYCTPMVAIEGQKIYCSANFAYTPSLGSVYSGTLNISANYCPGSFVANYTCPSGSNYVYTASVELQAERQQVYLGPYYYLPLTVTNLAANVPTQPGFQLQVNLTPTSYSQYERGDLGNIRFYYGTEEVSSWCESGCNSSGSKAIFWVKIPYAIPANSAVPLKLYFLPKNIEYSGRYAGEAPQLSCPNPSNTIGCSTYGEYDNGADVFSNYWNFAGTALSNLFIQEMCPGAAVSQDNGVTFTTPSSCGYGGVIINTPINSPVILEGDVSAFNGVAGGLAEQANSSCDTRMYIYNGWTGGYEGDSPSRSQGMCGGFNSMSTAFAFSSGIDGVIWSSSGEKWYHNYATYTTTDSFGGSLPSSIYISIGIYSYSTSTSITFQWLRTRVYPPNGVMPEVTFGSVAQV